MAWEWDHPDGFLARPDSYHREMRSSRRSFGVSSPPLARKRITGYSFGEGQNARYLTPCSTTPLPLDLPSDRARRQVHGYATATTPRGPEDTRMSVQALLPLGDQKKDVRRCERCYLSEARRRVYGAVNANAPRRDQNQTRKSRSRSELAVKRDFFLRILFFIISWFIE